MNSHVMKLKLVIILIFLLSNLYACQSTTTPGFMSQVTQSSPQVTIQGSSAGKEELQTIEIDNCDGKGDVTRIEQRSQSVDVTISAELALRLGASAEVISAEVQATVGSAITQGGQRSTSIQLTAPPKTRMLFQLVWTGKEQIGVVQNLRGSNIPIAFRGFAPTDVRIKSQTDIGCLGSSLLLPVFTPIPQSTPTNPPPPTARPTVTQQTLSSFPTTNCQETIGLGQFFPPLPSAPPSGCVLIVEWWVPSDPNNCGILITFNAPFLPKNSTGTWWYVYPNRPQSHIQEFLQKTPHCKVEDLR